MQLHQLHEAQVGNTDKKVYRTAEVYDLINAYKNRPDVFGTYVNVPMLKLNYRYQKGDAIAVYVYPIDKIIQMKGNTHWGYGNRQYLIIFKVPEINGPGVLHFKRSNTNKLKTARRLLQTLGKTTTWIEQTLMPYEALYIELIGSIDQPYIDKRAEIISGQKQPGCINDDAFIYQMMNNNHTTNDGRTRTLEMTKACRALGIWGAIDHGTGTIGEPHQGMFTDLSKLETLELVDLRNTRSITNKWPTEHKAIERRANNLAKAFTKHLDEPNSETDRHHAVKIYYKHLQSFKTQQPEFFKNSKAKQKIYKSIQTAIRNAPPNTPPDILRILNTMNQMCQD